VTLREKQVLFARLLGTLLSEAFGRGYQVTMGEAYRSKEEAERLAAKGLGIKNSLHRLRLAVDLNLFRGDQYLTKTEDYAALGVYWKSLHELCRWGGDFQRRDGGHFSITHNGVS